MVLTKTLLPLPVAPAISKWGILVRSSTTGWPRMSLPRATVSGEAACWYSEEASNSRR